MVRCLLLGLIALADVAGLVLGIYAICQPDGLLVGLLWLGWLLLCNLDASARIRP